MRLLVLLLILANALAFYWFNRQQNDRPTAPPHDERATVPRLVLLSERPPPTTAVVVPLSAREQPPSPVSKQSAADPGEAPAPAQPAVTLCLASGPFDSDENLSTARKALAELPSAVISPREETIAGTPTYWISLDSKDRLIEARRNMSKLRAAGIGDIAIIPLKNGGYIVSLGVYRSAEIAEQRRQQITALGYKVRIKKRQPLQRRYWLDIRLSTLADNAQELIDEIERRHPEFPILPRSCSDDVDHSP